VCPAFCTLSTPSQPFSCAGGTRNDRRVPYYFHPRPPILKRISPPRTCRTTQNVQILSNCVRKALSAQCEGNCLAPQEHLRTAGHKAKQMPHTGSLRLSHTKEVFLKPKPRGKASRSRTEIELFKGRHLRFWKCWKVRVSLACQHHPTVPHTLISYVLPVADIAFWSSGVVPQGHRMAQQCPKLRGFFSKWIVHRLGKDAACAHARAAYRDCKRTAFARRVQGTATVPKWTSGAVDESDRAGRAFYTGGHKEAMVPVRRPYPKFT
jgi:hypothetical protein